MSSSEQPEGSAVPASDADLAQAFKDLVRGEKTAQILESNLTNLEKKIDDLLASFESEKVEGEKDQGVKDNQDSDGVKKE